MHMENYKESLGKQGEQLKKWDELTIEEKIERTRSIVKGSLSELSRENSRLRELVYKLEHVLNEHDHLNGKVVIHVTGIECRQVIGETCRESKSNDFF